MEVLISVLNKTSKLEIPEAISVIIDLRITKFYDQWFILICQDITLEFTRDTKYYLYSEIIWTFNDFRCNNPRVINHCIKLYCTPSFE